MLIDFGEMTRVFRQPPPGGAEPGAPPSPGKRRRPGSRPLLAVALAAAALGGLFAGAHAADLISGWIGITSTPVRLVLKVACVAAALPAAFYLVERIFLSRSTRAEGNGPGRSGPRRKP